MSDTRIKREEIKAMSEQRRNERADAADDNIGAAGGCDCEDDACEWHDEN